jgi:WD40 repeat protein
MQAQSAQFAAVWLWDMGTWLPAGPPLEAHSLTVTQMAFSSDGQHLLTVSRDRTLAVFQRCPQGSLDCTLINSIYCDGSHMHTVRRLCLNNIGDLYLHALAAAGEAILLTRPCRKTGYWAEHHCLGARSIG